MSFVLVVNHDIMLAEYSTYLLYRLGANTNLCASIIVLVHVILVPSNAVNAISIWQISMQSNPS